MGAYNPGQTIQGGAMMAQGIGRGLSKMADSHRRAAEILKEREDKRKAEVKQAKAIETLVEATPMLNDMMANRLNMNMEDFKRLSVDEKLAIGEGLLKVPGYMEAAQKLRAANLENQARSTNLETLGAKNIMDLNLGAADLSYKLNSIVPLEIANRDAETRQQLMDGQLAAKVGQDMAALRMSQFDADNAERFLKIKEMEAQSGKTRSDSYAEQTNLAKMKWERENGAGPDDFSMVNFFGMDRAAVESVVQAEADPKKRANKLKAAQRYFKYLQEANDAFDVKGSGKSTSSGSNAWSGPQSSGGQESGVKDIMYEDWIKGKR